jgi:hypothetical protein
MAKFCSDNQSANFETFATPFFLICSAKTGCAEPNFAFFQNRKISREKL